VTPGEGKALEPQPSSRGLSLKKKIDLREPTGIDQGGDVARAWASLGYAWREVKWGKGLDLAKQIALKEKKGF